MKAVIQRVKSANVTENGNVLGRIGKGMLVLLGVGNNDAGSNVEWMANKLRNLRIFEDGNGKMNLSVIDVGGEILVVSQFTLYGDCRKGNRPGFSESAPPEKAIPLYEEFISALRLKNVKTETGKFGAKMEVELVNDGPVTFCIEG